MPPDFGPRDAAGKAHAVERLLDRTLLRSWAAYVERFTVITTNMINVGPEPSPMRPGLQGFEVAEH